jgi:hypothetical protein
VADLFDTSGMGSYDSQLFMPGSAGVSAAPASLPTSAPNTEGFNLPGGIGMWSSIAGGLTNSIADAIEGYTEQKRYREAAKAAGDADMAQAFMRMAAYIQDQQAMSDAIAEAGAANAFDPQATGAADLQAAGAPLAGAAREIVGGTGGVLAQQGLANTNRAVAAQRQMGEGSQRAMRPLQDFFNEAGDRRAAAESFMNMAGRYNQSKVNEALANDRGMGPVTDFLRLAGNTAQTAGMFL